MKITRELPLSSLIVQLALHIKSEFNRAFQAYGVNITTDQWGILKCLWQEESVTQSELAEKTNKDKASITRILDIMQKNNLITRRDDVVDRRSYRIFLTEEGKMLERKLRPIAHATNQKLSQNLKRKVSQQ